jgi:putative DNA methylase
MTYPPVLIEDWLPFDMIGAESLRDASAARKPPLNRLHVWWARRPLTVSRAAVLAGTLPQWSADWPAHLRRHFPDERSYRAWFMRLPGIRGDPVAGRKLIQQAKAQGVQLQGSPYGGPRAFTVNPSPDDLRLLGGLLEHTWGTCEAAVLDPTAGGGSIPFEALRYGFTTYANELNPVASVILTATLDYPARYGSGLADDIRRWGDVWAERVRERLADYFPKQPNESIFAYLWARTVACPATGKPVPLSPNWWLSRGDDPVAVQVIADPAWDVPQFVIKRGAEIDFDPDAGTVSRGVGRSPWTGEAIDGDYIKAEAQAGRMGQMLYAVANKRPGTPDFRPPVAEDLEGTARAEAELARRLPAWEAAGLVPREPYPEVSNDPRPLLYGMLTWADFFSPRASFSRC